MSEIGGNTEIKMGSERSFGLVFAGFFLIIAFLPLTDDGSIRVWALILAGAFGVAAFSAPHLLRPLNRLWFRVGLVLNKIVSPIIMGVLFLVAVTPIGLIVRARNGDPLQQKFDACVETYWIPVDPEHAARSSMRKQF